MIIVTGATGFIGSNIVADLNLSGRTDIILVDDLGTHGKWKNIAKRRFADLVLPSELAALLEKLSGADIVYHMGANSSTTVTEILSSIRISVPRKDFGSGARRLGHRSFTHLRRQLMEMARMVSSTIRAWVHWTHCVL